MHVNVVFVMYSWFGHSLFTFLRYVEILLLDFLASEWFFVLLSSNARANLKKTNQFVYGKLPCILWVLCCLVSFVHDIETDMEPKRKYTQKNTSPMHSISLFIWFIYTRNCHTLGMLMLARDNLVHDQTSNSTLSRFPPASLSCFAETQVHSYQIEVWYEAASQNIKSLNKLRALKQNYDFAIRIGPNQSQCLGD